MRRVIQQGTKPKTATRTERQKITEAMAPTLRYVLLNYSLSSATELEREHV